MFGLVMPEKVAEEVVDKYVRMTFDPDTKELVQVVMPFMTKTEVMTLTVDKGWVTEASVEDIKLLPGVHRRMFRLQGGEWVAREIVKDVNAGRAKFVDQQRRCRLVGQPRPHGRRQPILEARQRHHAEQLPPPDDEMRAAGLDGRWFIGVGNHEVWGDPKIEGTLSAVPYLRKLGVTPENLIYKFDFRDCRFIFLWSGKYDYRSPSNWDADRPKYEEQMAHMKEWLDEAKAKGIPKVFIIFHYPVFARAGLGPIPFASNPHRFIASYAKDFELVVFNGHVHTTEMYDGRWREISDAGRRRGGAGPDPARPDEQQGAGRLSSGPLLERRAAEGRV